MKVNLPLYFIGIVLVILAIIIILTSINTKFALYLKQNWPNITIAFLGILLGSTIAVSGVWWAFQKETNRSLEIQIDTFKRSFAAVISECAENQAKINKLKQTTTTDQLNLNILSIEVSKSIVSNPMLYKYVGDEYLLALQTYITLLERINRIQELTSKTLDEAGTISDKKVTNLNNLFDECLYYTYILQYQSQLYAYSYNVKFGPKPSNNKEIKDWLKKRQPISIKELKSKINALGKTSEQSKSEMRKSMKKALEEDHFRYDGI